MAQAVNSRSAVKLALYIQFRDAFLISERHGHAYDCRVTWVTWAAGSACAAGGWLPAVCVYADARAAAAPVLGGGVPL